MFIYAIFDHYFESKSGRRYAMFHEINTGSVFRIDLRFTNFAEELQSGSKWCVRINPIGMGERDAFLSYVLAYEVK